MAFNNPKTSRDQQQLMVSCGMDNKLLIWNLSDPVLDTALTSTSCKTVFISRPIFSTAKVHSNYPDCVMWFGDLILSKAITKQVENKIIAWQPARHQFTAEKDSVSAIRSFVFRDCNYWFVKFCMDWKQQYLCVGNQSGEIFVWDLYQDPTPSPAVSSTRPASALLRRLCFTHDNSNIFAACDDGKIYVFTNKSPKE